MSRFGIQMKISDCGRLSEAVAAANKAIAALSDNVSFLTLFTEQPIRQEMIALVDDAQQAVVFITNCIPQGPSGVEITGDQIPEIPDN